MIRFEGTVQLVLPKIMPTVYIKVDSAPNKMGIYANKHRFLHACRTHQQEPTHTESVHYSTIAKPMPSEMSPIRNSGRTTLSNAPKFHKKTESPSLLADVFQKNDGIKNKDGNGGSEN